MAVNYNTRAITILDAHMDALAELARDAGLVDRDKPNVSAMVRALVQAEVMRKAKAEGKSGGRWTDILNEIRAQRVLTRGESIVTKPAG